MSDLLIWFPPPGAVNSRINAQTTLREKFTMSSTLYLQNLPKRLIPLAFAPNADFAIVVTLRRMATVNGVTPFYLLAPEVNALLHYIPNRKHYFLFSIFWKIGARIGKACSLTPESFMLDGSRPFVRILSEKMRSQRVRPPKDSVRLVPLTDPGYVRQVES